ncbi:glycoside hydrolase N-terminal domain-containing protein [uncultured Metabacillus sp.]|uniref:glycosyl hydrolase family 95 catalytic domain-containing protein n=1 Tax=uncultured Metabacillus sp. TaxID=2860135 RepID=UPI00262FDEA8|nr:glycoside hydrolase N-terminal domain-containing protein [uncultured Metabacillus sp.]
MVDKNDSRNRLSLKYPAGWWRNMWREGLPSGNGKVGASVSGGVSLEKILINHEGLWHMGRKDTLPDVSYTLSETRDLMKKEKYHEASWHLTNTLKEKGYSTRLASFLPLVELTIRMKQTEGFKHYRREVNMETGEVSVRWEEGNERYERNLFVSRADDAVVYEITSTGKSLTAEFELGIRKTDHKNMEQRLKELESAVQLKVENQFIFFSAKNDDHSDYGAVIRLIPMGGRTSVDKNRLRCEEANYIQMILKVFIKGDHREEWARLKAELLEINGDYQDLLRAHIPLHAQLFHTASIQLSDAEGKQSIEELLLDAYEGEAPLLLLEKLWNYGRYLFISGTRAEGQPFGMYGLWGGDYNLMWCHRMANENIQMMYWHASVGGLSELVPALFNYYEEMMDEFRENARTLYGCRGIYIPAGTTPGIGVPNQIVPVIMNWTGAAGWLAQHYYDYYLYTGDEKLLIEKVLPFLKEVALFYEDFLVLDENGLYQFFPSVSPENTPENFMPKDGKQLAHPMPTTINATMDFAIMKEVLNHLIEGAKETSLYLDEIEKWEGMLERIPPYEVNKDGAVREWLHPAFDDRYNHRHLSHIYPVFPGRDINQEQDQNLFEAFRMAVSKRRLGAQTGWSLAHMSSIWARMNDGDKALECLDILSRSCLLNNLFTVHNDWRNMGVSMEIETAPIQLDASMGIVNAIQEMLLYVSPKLIKLLPALPTKWEKGEVKNFRFMTGRVSLSWNVVTQSLCGEMTAERDSEFTLKLPSFAKNSVLTGEGITIKESSLGKMYVYITMEKGTTLYVKNMID